MEKARPTEYISYKQKSELISSDSIFQVKQSYLIFLSSFNNLEVGV